MLQDFYMEIENGHVKVRVICPRKMIEKVKLS